MIGDAPSVTRIFVAGVPAAKGRPRFDRRSGRAYSPSKTVRYEDMLRMYFFEALPDGPLDAPLAVRMVFWMPEPKSMAKKWRGLHLPHLKRPDLDNLVKMVLDAGNRTLFLDDSQVYRCNAEKYYRSDQTGTEVFLTPFEGKVWR